VKIVGYTDLASRMALQASELYAMTVYNLLEELITKDGQFVIDMDDEAQRGATVIKEGEITWPPPQRPKMRSGAPRPEPDKPKLTAPPKPPESKLAGPLAAVAALLLGAVGLVAPGDFLAHLTVFLLACVVGWHVVWNVTPALHTPLMSVTNAISGIILLGGMLLVLGVGVGSVLAAIAVLLASINVAGGFLVTQRMLRMFRK
jgi:NAD(P) transhydrogenase subunit alpha